MHEKERNGSNFIDEVKFNNIETLNGNMVNDN